MSNSIYYASQALGYFYATQRGKEVYEVSATSTLDQQLENLTSLNQQLSNTWMYPQQPNPSMHYDYSPRFYQPQSYQPSPPDILSYALKLFFYFLLLNHKYICN